MPAKSSFSLLGVIDVGKDPMTTRFVGFPVLADLVTTTRLDLESEFEDLDFSDGPTTMRCQIKVIKITYW